MVRSHCWTFSLCICSITTASRRARVASLPMPGLPPRRRRPRPDGAVLEHALASAVLRHVEEARREAVAVHGEVGVPPRHERPDRREEAGEVSPRPGRARRTDVRGPERVDLAAEL